MLALAAVGTTPAHARPPDRVATPLRVADAGFRAGPSINRSWLWVMTRPTQSGHFLKEHLFGDTAQTVAQERHE